METVPGPEIFRHIPAVPVKLHLPRFKFYAYIPNPKPNPVSKLPGTDPKQVMSTYLGHVIAVGVPISPHQPSGCVSI